LACHNIINSEARADAQAWLFFLKNFNGTSLFLQETWQTSDALNLGTDASGKHYAALYNSKWFVGDWPESWENKNITIKELFPIVLALKIWAPLWKNHKIMFFFDNMAVVDIINNQSSKDTSIMYLVRELVIVAINNNVLFRARHVPGKPNIFAIDYLALFYRKREEWPLGSMRTQRRYQTHGCQDK